MTSQLNSFNLVILWMHVTQIKLYIILNHIQISYECIGTVYIFSFFDSINNYVRSCPNTTGVGLHA